ncbi:MAG: hypothetical protein KF709_02470 [Gemmatimonadaceae bacterium]|nr:hypothetical protein [Gemmatimonadaceae bacterium]
MTAPATVRSERPIERTFRLSLDEPLVLDVSYCDLVHAHEPNVGPFALRFRGTRQPDAQLVRGFVPLVEIEGGLLTSGALARPLDTSGLPPGDRGFLAVPLVHFALTLTKRRKGNGTWMVEVGVRRGVATDLQQYLQLLSAAAEHAVPVLTKHGLYAGSAEVISIAGQLFAARTNRMEGRAG